MLVIVYAVVGTDGGVAELVAICSSDNGALVIHIHRCFGNVLETIALCGSLNKHKIPSMLFDETIIAFDSMCPRFGNQSHEKTTLGGSDQGKWNSKYDATMVLATIPNTLHYRFLVRSRRTLGTTTRCVMKSVRWVKILHTPMAMKKCEVIGG